MCWFSKGPYRRLEEREAGHEKAKFGRKSTPGALVTFLPREKLMIYCIIRLSRVLNYFLDMDPDSFADVTPVLLECFRKGPACV